MLAIYIIAVLLFLFILVTNPFPVLLLFIRFVLNVFFRELKVRGVHRVPLKGPVILAVAPHANQFVDPMMLVVTCGADVGFLA
jgi:glycerol-3-phosphate O-acyltransferase/dihydroxyacetone phosphate acyltransferase